MKDIASFDSATITDICATNPISGDC